MALYDTPENIAALATLDDEFAQILATMPPQEALPEPEMMRQYSNAMEEQQYSAGATTKVREHTIKITMRDGHENEAIVYQSALRSPSQSPLVVLCYGGGFILGTNKQYAATARAAALLYGATVVNISYRLAPENPFPTPANDVWDNIEWLARNAHTLNADLSAGFILGGGSAGANLAAVATHKAIRTNLSPPLTGLYLAVPFLLMEDIVPDQYESLWIAREQNSKAPILNEDALNGIMAAYQPHAKSPEFSPFNDPESFSKLPRTYVQVAGLDPLRDDGLVYERVLKDHGIETRLDVYPGVPHGFNGMFPRLKQSKRFDIETAVGLGWLLRVKEDRERVEAFFIDMRGDA
ncbi:alpha/beta-hydrolase [Aureobasidium pullulans]|nr:alpha/beta-hydrolase [Aureobasidium pullulans]